MAASCVRMARLLCALGPAQRDSSLWEEPAISIMIASTDTLAFFGELVLKVTRLRLPPMNGDARCPRGDPRRGRPA